MSVVVEITHGNESVCCGEFTYNTTVLDIKKYYCSYINNNIPIDRVILNYMSQPMNSNKNIKYYDDDVNFKFICEVSHATFGGAEQKIESNKKYKVGVEIKGRKRVISERDRKKLKISNKSCVIYGDTGTNVIMPCGHVYCPQACFEVGHKTFANSTRATKIFCAMKCKTEWPFKYWMRAACLYKDEYFAIKKAIQIRLMPETKDCPHCGIGNVKPQGLNMKRVACACRKGDWCWVCNKPWIGGGFTYCGNPKCSTNVINRLLSKCESKNLGASYGNVVVPKLRACIKCYNLIEHSSACKHMTCRQCKQKFCFSCLKAPNADGSWPCKSYDFKCPAAPRQKIK